VVACKCLLRVCLCLRPSPDFSCLCLLLLLSLLLLLLSPPCSGTVDEVQEVVAKARMWRWKPYGEVTLRFTQDANVSVGGMC
jgi:hypothetical protein